MRKLFIFAMAVIMTVAVANFGFALKKDVEFKTCGDEGKSDRSHVVL